ncbi:MAG: AIPR family protein [Candidatus Helarchaeota archaeon]
MDLQYKTLINILDYIREEAPNKNEFQLFRSSVKEHIEASRSIAYIHLFLWVKFGLQDFDTRQEFICDGKFDGGLDAYYFDHDNLTIYLIQSKFRNSDSNFRGKNISADELVKMEIGNILTGENEDSNGNCFNESVKEFQKKYKNIPNKAEYSKRVVILANLSQYNDQQINRLIDDFDYEIVDFTKSFSDLVEPICSGSYYAAKKIMIKLSLSDENKDRLKQRIKTSYGTATIEVLFIPTKEIARIMSQYQNSILLYNPRCFLGFGKGSKKPSVNSSIRKSILDSFENDFAILNNGITFLADESRYTDMSGEQNIGQIILTNPQIINGGQTAFSLSEIYNNEYMDNNSIFDHKEVLVKIIVFNKSSEEIEHPVESLISAVSSSTNKQNEIKPADYKSGNAALVKAKQQIYYKFGYFLETKLGLYKNGLENGFIDTSALIDRGHLMRIYQAVIMKFPAKARRSSESVLFSDDNLLKFEEVFDQNEDKIVSQIMLGYLLYLELDRIQKEQGNCEAKIGLALRYGKYAVLTAVILSANSDLLDNIDKLNLSDLKMQGIKQLDLVLDKWKTFEDFVVEKTPIEKFEKEGLFNFDKYYKTNILDKDIQRFWANEK